MALGTDYAQQDCSLARALELVGERWTMLIVRDAFFGVLRFSDFEHHLDISKAVLTQRLSTLVEAGVMERKPRGGHDDYTLTSAGLALWPALFALSQWGESQASTRGPRRIFSHAGCGSDLETSGLCRSCGTVPAPGDLEMRPGPGVSSTPREDRVSSALRGRRRVLDPVRP